MKKDSKICYVLLGQVVPIPARPWYFFPGAIPAVMGSAWLDARTLCTAKAPNTPKPCIPPLAPPATYQKEWHLTPSQVAGILWVFGSRPELAELRQIQGGFGHEYSVGP